MTKDEQIAKLKRKVAKLQAEKLRLEHTIEYANERAAYFKQWVYSANGQQRSL